MSTIKVLIPFFILTSSILSFAQDTNYPLPYDSSALELRAIDIAEVEKLKSDSDFDYGESVAAINLWERFKRWIGYLISQLLNTVANANWFNLVVYIVVIVGLVYVILRLLRIDALSVFYRSNKLPLTAGILDEDIHVMDFEKLIAEALTNNNYRLAVRLQFLQALKLLTDHQYIYWQAGKTNHDYLNELTADHLKDGLTELNQYFEHAWYGNFSVNETLYRKVDHLFNQWKTTI